MQRTVLPLLATLFLGDALLLTSCDEGPIHVAPSNPNITYIGRVQDSNPDAPIMVYPGSKITMDFKASTLAMETKPNSGYWMVSVDDQPAQKIHFSATDSIVAIDIEALDSDKPHHLEAMLVYEGYNDRPEFRGFHLNGHGEVLPPNEQYTQGPKLEFIGNSITCGYGVEATRTDGSEAYSDSTVNHYYSYAQIASRRLNAQTMVVARSGIGVYRNYDGNPAGDADAMSHWYDYTLLYDSTAVWNPNRFSPELICINLGTNDLSTPGFDLDLYADCYANFVRHLHELQPQAGFVFITGSMLNGEVLEQQKHKLDSIANILRIEGQESIYRFDFTPQDGSLGYGADWHPSKQQQEVMADEITLFLRSVLDGSEKMETL